MQLAASIRYGGLLVNAADCNYDDYRKLGLTCPHCHESVFLVQGHERHYQKTSKVIEVASHFCHRADKNKEAIALCELRSRQITSVEIHQSETKSRNQRLQLFNRYLWSILSTCYKLKKFEQKQHSVDNGFKNTCKSAEMKEQVLKDYKSFFIQAISSYKNNIISEADSFITDLMKKVSNDKLVFQEELKGILILWRQQIDAKMQVEIYKEAVSCLLQRKHLPILEKLIIASLDNFVIVNVLSRGLDIKNKDTLQIFNSFFTGDIEINQKTAMDTYQVLVEAIIERDSKNLSAVYHFVRDDVLETIAFTPWAEGFEKFSN